MAPVAGRRRGHPRQAEQLSKAHSASITPSWKCRSTRGIPRDGAACHRAAPPSASRGWPLLRLHRHGYRGVDPVSIRRQRLRRPEADLRTREPAWSLSARRVYGSCRSNGEDRQDAAILFDAIAGADDNDSTSLRLPVEVVSLELTGHSRASASDSILADGAENVEETAPAIGRGPRRASETPSDHRQVDLPDLIRVDDAWMTCASARQLLRMPGLFPVVPTTTGLAFGSALRRVAQSPTPRLRAPGSSRGSHRTTRPMLAEIDCLVCPSMSNAAAKRKPTRPSRQDDSWGAAWSRRHLQNRPISQVARRCRYGAAHRGWTAPKRPVRRAVSRPCSTTWTTGTEQATEWHTEASKT